MNEFELTQELKDLIRKNRALEASKPAVLSDAAAVVEHARISQEIEENARRQVELGKQMLELQQAREQRTKERLAASAAEGERLVEQLLATLPAFAERLDVAFKALGAEYAEVVRLSKEIHQVNSALGQANRAQVGRGSAKIVPNHLHTLVKSLFRECFGADVPLPQRSEAFDMKAAVEDVRTSAGR